MARRPTVLQRQLDALWTAVETAGGPGSVGPKGDKGDKGDTGETGPAGADGAPGDDGSSGAQGVPGETGAAGPQGPTGNDGNDGSDGAPGADGPSAYQVALTNGFVGTQAQWLASLVGAKGDDGAAGATGATGTPGADGANGSDGNDGAAGATGPQGPKGDTGIAGTDATVNNANVNTAIADNRPATKTALLLVKGDVGLGSADNTADVAKAVLSATKFATARNINGVAFDGSANITINAVDSTARVPATRSVSTTAPLTGGGDLSADRSLAISAATTGAAGSMSAADKTKLDGVASAASANSSDATLLARANHTGTQTLDTTTDSATRLAMTAAERTKLSGIATSATANSTDAALSAAYRTLLDSSGSHIAARVAGTYGFGQGDPLAITGVGTLYPLNVIRIDAADYPAIGALTAKLRVKATINCNDVAPGHNFVLGLHPITRPGTSGGAGLCIYTIGAAVASSTVTATTPAADSSAAFTSADFALPADGQYVLGVVTNGTTATSAHVHLSAALQLHHA